MGREAFQVLGFRVVKAGVFDGGLETALALDQAEFTVEFGFDFAVDWSHQQDLLGSGKVSRFFVAGCFPIIQELTKQRGSQLNWHIDEPFQEQHDISFFGKEIFGIKAFRRELLGKKGGKCSLSRLKGSVLATLKQRHGKAGDEAERIRIFSFRFDASPHVVSQIFTNKGGQVNQVYAVVSGTKSVSQVLLD